jgi:hypothetical protein
MNRIYQLLSGHLETTRYTLYKSPRIPSGGGTREIDILVISQFGIFVIASIYRKGWISGSEVQNRWKQVRFGRTSHFDNPIHQNFLRMQALERFLGLPQSRLHSVVTFTGHRGISKDTRPNLIEERKLVSYIRSKRQKLLSPEEANEAIKLLNQVGLKQQQSWIPDRLTMLRLLLAALLAWMAWTVYKDELSTLHSGLLQRMHQDPQPAEVDSVIQKPLSREQWEESLNCAFSSDSGRCTCHDDLGNIQSVTASRCQELAERGSILKQ